MAEHLINLLEMGKRIKELRLRQKKTQTYFADMLYISPSYLALIENGKRTVTIDVLAQIANVCNVTTDYLLFGTPVQQADLNKKAFQRLSDVYSPEDISKALQISEFYLELEKNKSL